MEYGEQLQIAALLLCTNSSCKISSAPAHSSDTIGQADKGQREPIPHARRPPTPALPAVVRSCHPDEARDDGKEEDPLNSSDPLALRSVFCVPMFPHREPASEPVVDLRIPASDVVSKEYYY